MSALLGVTKLNSALSDFFSNFRIRFVRKLYFPVQKLRFFNEIINTQK
jgi:hypothetical protein